MEHDPTPILVPLDMSPLSRQAVAVAADLARRMNHRIHLLVVVDGPLSHHVEEVANAEGKTMNSVVDEYLERIAAGIEPGIGVSWSHRYAVEASDDIALCAGEMAAPLIVMASHGRSGLGRLLTGSVTEATVRSSKVPVVVVPSADHVVTPSWES